MYVSIGPGAVVRRGDLVGVFDLDNATWSHRTRKSLAVCEREGRVIAVGDDLPRAPSGADLAAGENGSTTPALLSI